jgi:hypothetical protein
VYQHINDRSNLDEVVAYNPVTKERITRRMMLERSNYMRSDIVLFHGTRTGQQYCLYATESGFAGDLCILDMLSDEDFRKVNEIADKMRENVKVFEPARKLLTVHI